MKVDMHNKSLLWLWISLNIGFDGVIGLDTKETREGKFLSLFQVITFPNDGCTGSGRSGTCYTAEQCSSRGGINAGSCAQGFGVCCTFTIGCGARSRENCTYIESSNPTAGECRHTICPCNDNICQLRLDFDTFVITGPSTNTNAETFIIGGAIDTTTDIGVANSYATQCLTDSFSVTNSAGTNPAPICGVNSGQHMYVDVDRSRGGTGCNELNFVLGASGYFAEIPTRQWSIKVSQIECNSRWRAPSGCTQYFTEPEDTVQSYNYAGGQHLAFQRQSICVRRARGQCRICWSAVMPDDFALSGGTLSAPPPGGAPFNSGLTKRTKCCGYPTDLLNRFGFDCLQIPGAMTMTNGNLIKNSRFCGRNAGLVTADTNTAAATICSRETPFVIRFVSDGYEVAGANAEAAALNKGFNLAYFQDSTNCEP